jgi:hypothetical protein
MKKTIFAAAALTAVAFSAQAQDVKFGVKAGVNFSNFSGDAEDANIRTGFHVGGLAEIKFGNFAVQPELLYSTAGAKTKYNDGFDNYDVTAKLSYITIPVAAKYYIAEGFNIQAGPQFAFRTSAKGKVETSGVSVEADMKDQYKGFDLGIFGGVGYELQSGLLFSARYVQGVSNISDGEGADDFKVQNTNIQLSVGYKF